MLRKILNLIYSKNKTIILKNSLDEFKIEKKINSGSSGDLLIAKRQENGKIYAIKMLNFDRKKINRWERFQFKKEAILLLEIDNHINIIKPYQIDTVGNDRLCIVMDYFPMSLRNLINTKDSLRLKEILSISRQIASALIFLHDKVNIIHRDLKPENIMLGADQTIKVADFGLSHSLGISGSLPYMAPEQHFSRRPNKLWDVFAFGIIFFELFKKQLPYSQEILLNNSNIEYQQFKINNGIKNILDLMTSEIPVNYRNILYGCLEVDPKNRFSNFKEISSMLT